MATGLKSALQSPQSPFILRSAIAGAAYFAAFRAGGYLTALFVVLAAGFYLFPFFRTRAFLPAWLMIVVAGVLSLHRLPGEYAFFASLVFATLFYVLLSLKNLMLVNRTAWHYGLYLALAYLLSALFFFSGATFGLGAVLYYLSLFFIARELVGGGMALTLLTGFFAVQASWVIGKLPLGFVNGASLMLVVLYAASEIIRKGKEGRLSARSVLATVTVTVILILIVFIATAWRLPTF